MRIRLVVAVAENGVIGRDGAMPWRLSTDMKRFKATTMGKGGRKRRSRRKSAANHRKRPNA